MTEIRDRMFFDEFSGRYFMSTRYKVNCKLKKLYDDERLVTLNEVYETFGLDPIKYGEKFINPMEYELSEVSDKTTNSPIIVLRFRGRDMDDFDEMYEEFEGRYNPYPVQMSRAEAFRKALDNGAIDKETYLAARRYYGNLWFYVGD